MARVPNYTQATGALNRRVSVSRTVSTNAPNGYGGFVSKTATTPVLTRVAARVSPVKGDESVIAAGRVSTQVYFVWVRFSSASDAVLNSDTLTIHRNKDIPCNILAKENLDEDNQFIRFTVIEGAAL